MEQASSYDFRFKENDKILTWFPEQAFCGLQNPASGTPNKKMSRAQATHCSVVQCSTVQCSAVQCAPALAGHSRCMHPTKDAAAGLQHRSWMGQEHGGLQMSGWKMRRCLVAAAPEVELGWVGSGWVELG